MYTDEADAFCRMQASPRTRTEYRKDLDRWFESGFPLTVEGVSLYRQHLTNHFKSSSAGRFWSTARTFHRWLVNRGLLEYSPFEIVKAPKRSATAGVQAPSDNIVDALVASAEAGRERVIIWLLLNGLRASEVANLRTADIYHEPQYGHYLRFVGKGDKERIVPALEETVAAIAELPEDDSPWLLSDTNGSKLTYDQVNATVDKVAKRAGVKTWPHQLRHHYGTRLVRAGANVIVVSKLLGHANVQTTQRYVTMDISDLVEASRLDPRNQMGGIRLVQGTQAEASTREGADAIVPREVASA